MIMILVFAYVDKSIIIGRNRLKISLLSQKLYIKHLEFSWCITGNAARINIEKNFSLIFEFLHQIQHSFREIEPIAVWEVAEDIV